jgi:hypothetical protein
MEGMSQPNDLSPTILTIACVGVFIGLANLPYDYYRLLRLFLCGASLFYLTVPAAQLTDAHKALLIGFAILYNPIVPVYLRDKSLWIVLNFATVGYFAWINGRGRWAR